ncbi:acyl carrier protein [Nocardia sp. NPDC019395]|uniref:acyl carrier protein n=1 Tax=Nocardia sp. NPDC019395 TaxID=3154686 RepID=UPI0033E9503A
MSPEGLPLRRGGLGRGGLRARCAGWSDQRVHDPGKASGNRSHPDPAEQLRRFFSAMTGTEVQPDDDIFELGLVNSLRALEIVAHVEQTYGLTVEVEDLDLDNFRSAGRLAAFVMRKQAGER